MKTTKILYWVFTGLFVAFMLFSGIGNAMLTEDSVNILHHYLGYPIYFIVFIGVAKAVGAIALFIPRMPRLTEWVYAGFAFDLIGATYSVIAVKGNVMDGLGMLPFIIVGACSYIFYHKKLKLANN